MGRQEIDHPKLVLTIDVGNTSAFFAVFHGNKVVLRWRIPTWQVNRKTVLSLKRRIRRRSITAAVIASVVPRATALLSREIPKEIGIKSYVIGRDFGAPIMNRYKDPRQVGIDRLVNAAEAYDRYRRDAIVIDFGTAITFDIISRKGEYLGGVIAPGIEISLEALYQKTALLPKIRLAHPQHLIGRDTIESIRVGCSVGIGGLCDRLVERIAERYGLHPLIIATGGYAKFMRQYCDSIQKIDPELTMRGILLCYKKFLTKKTRCL